MKQIIVLLTHSRSDSPERDSELIVVKALRNTFASEFSASDSDGGINIHPNPSQGVFSVQVNGAEGDGMIRITKSGGQIVYSQVYTGQALNISGFTKGEYTVYYIENQVVKASAWLIVE